MDDGKDLVTGETKHKQYKISQIHDAQLNPTGKISGNTLTVSSADVPNPVKIRYAWSDNPARANIYGTNGLMLSPFEAE